MRCQFIHSLAAIPENDWNAIVGTDYPFLQYAFLHALESSGSVGEQRGWQPHHLLVFEDDQLIALLPLYLKQHSYGEYVFDWSWANAYEQHGVDYYPKLVAAIPFTPATGPRLCHQLIDPDTIHTLTHTIFNYLADQCGQLGYSGWHLLFPQAQEQIAWKSTGMAPRIACHFQWFNHDYADFDAFLARFSSRKRKNVKKERKRVHEQGLQLQRLTGDAITTEHWRQFYHCYQMTYAKRSGHGGYLTPQFFDALRQHCADQILMVVAYQGDTLVAAALYFYSSDTLYGRYWGALEEVDALHFEACYYQGIEFCIERGLSRFDPGVQGEHKIMRGFEPVITHSCHHLTDPAFFDAVQRFVDEEATMVKKYQADATHALPYKTPTPES